MLISVIASSSFKLVIEDGAMALFPGQYRDASYTTCVDTTSRFRRKDRLRINNDVAKISMNSN